MLIMKLKTKYKTTNLIFKYITIDLFKYKK